MTDAMADYLIDEVSDDISFWHTVAVDAAIRATAEAERIEAVIARLRALAR